MRMQFITVLTAFAAAAFAVGAHAETAAYETETSSVTIAYGDLDLTKPAGTEILEARIDRAVEKVCAKPDLRQLKANQEFEACQAKAHDAAMEQLSLTNPFEGVALASAF
ncbi:MAG: UrcA family protein [Croceibacterium sp.]